MPAMLAKPATPFSPDARQNDLLGALSDADWTHLSSELEYVEVARGHELHAQSSSTKCSDVYSAGYIARRPD